MFSLTFLAVAAAVLTGVRAQGELTPPDYFALEVEANEWTTNDSYVGYYLRGFQVSNTQLTAVLAPEIIPAEFYQLVDPNVTETGTYYSLLLDGTEDPGYLTPFIVLQAYWEPLLFTYFSDEQTRIQQNVFYINGTQDAMYLQMRQDLEVGTYIGFQGFIGCYWSQQLPQLFFWTFYGEASPDELPLGCSFYNMRVIPLEKTY